MKFSSALVASLLTGSAFGFFRRAPAPEPVPEPLLEEFDLEKRWVDENCVAYVTVTVTMTGTPPETTTSTATHTNVVTVSTPAPPPPVATSSTWSVVPAPPPPSAAAPPPPPSVPAPPPPPSTAAPPPPPTTTAAAPSSVLAPPPEQHIQAPAASSAAPAQSSAPAQSYSPGSCHMVTNGNKWAMTYTQYTASGGCKSADEVNSDIAQIKAKGFTTIRMYGTDCSGLQNIGSAIRANGMKMLVGVFITKGPGISAAQSQVTDIVNWGQAGNWDIVSMIVVGNEAVSAGACDGPSLAGFVASSKAAFQAAGSGCIPVTTTEPVDIIVQNADVLCPVVDVIAANIQTYFNGGVVGPDAGSFAAGQLGQIASLCGGTKDHYNLESGWPSAGGSNGASVASPDAQSAAINSIIDTIGSKSIIFSFQNDNWKAPGIEQNFGCYNAIQ